MGKMMMETRNALSLSLRALLLGGALFVAGCQVSEFADGGAHLAPVPASLERKMQRLDMPDRSPIMLRIFKEEDTLEVWKRTRSGQYALLKEYEICAWSGKLGPKFKEGDRQAPEGFYTVNPGQMNPNSSYHLAFNIGFPNAYDRSHGRTGSHLMVHGDCSSRGCYAMEDENIQEIYALAREAFRGGQGAFQIQAFPFRMTPENMARHRDSEHFAFWEMLKEGYDHFEVVKQAPKVEVCGKRYVFNVGEKSGTFNASAECPAYEVRPDIEQLVAERRSSDLDKRKIEIARILQQGEREERWAEREAAIASFFGGGQSNGDSATAVIAAADGTVPTPRRAPGRSFGAPIATSSTASAFAPGAENHDGSSLAARFGRLFNRDNDGSSVAASNVAVTDTAPSSAATPVARTETGAAPAPTASPERAAEEDDGGILSSVAKTGQGWFKKAGSLFN